VTVFAHSQENEIKHRLAVLGNRRDRSHFPLGARGG
jgi:hypothetical protein